LLRLLPPHRARLRYDLSAAAQPHPARVKRRAVCARSRDVFTAR